MLEKGHYLLQINWIRLMTEDAWMIQAKMFLHINVYEGKITLFYNKTSDAKYSNGKKILIMHSKIHIQTLTHLINYHDLSNNTIINNLSQNLKFFQV